MEDSIAKITVVIDCSYNDYMMEKQIRSLIVQLQHCYASNRRSVQPLQLYISNLTGKMNKLMHDSKVTFDKWDVNYSNDHFLDIFEKQDIIYLTSDSENVIDKLQDGKCYVIGGLIDRNRHKNLCLTTAQDLQLYHARLPIPSDLLTTSTVLTTNQDSRPMANSKGDNHTLLVCNSKHY
ncbi:hypothetical protein A3Q56_00824 [Intoshia linei]|uniref:tRNA (guanine(9)-N(1))-methyltransferase n=1 Tax=Intoshia linei TaxID=1819745 RepID=A0A177BAX0_9BILA|nr:hypothetical protein A3Q56_00824 [Intoshia linei]